MPNQKLYPPVSDLISASALPGDFQSFENLIQGGLDLILDKIFYKDFTVQVSSSGDRRYYSLTLSTKALRIPLFSGMNLVFFYGEDSDLSDFPILFEWVWPLAKYIKSFEQDGFSYAPEAFVDILIELSEIRDRKDFFTQITTTFLNNGDTAYLDFLSSIANKVSTYDNSEPDVTIQIQNIVNQIGLISNEIESQVNLTNVYTIEFLVENYQNISALNAAVDSIKNSLEVLDNTFNISINLYSDVIISLIESLLDDDGKFDRLLNLFKGWLKDIDSDDLKKLLIPQFSIELLDINLALEFPRNWLVPAIPDPGNPGGYIEDPDINKLSALEFTVGNLKFSTEKGFEFENQSSFTFERSYIGKTGLMLAFDGLKVDMSKAYNIPEADADGRPEDFQGVYAESASVTLPEKWFKNQDTPGTTAEINARNLLIGTGGISGTIGLEAVGSYDMLWANIGDNGFRVGFERFDITFKQNKVIESNILGAMEIPKFVYPAGTLDENGVNIGGQIVTIGIAGHIHDDGDFNLTASATPPYPIELKEVFTYHIATLELGKQDDDFYIGTSGKIEFMGVLKETLKLKEIEIDRLRIYSDGSIEFEGGSIALVEPIVLNLGPVEITVSAIHYGSHQKEVNGEMRKFNYFGFDGGISVDPLGIEIRGDGVKFYYCTDNISELDPLIPKPKPYLHIKTLYLDLTIPASSPAAIINGWLSIPEPGTSPEYAGGIKLQLPQAKISGSADMKLQPRYPAFIIDASIEFPVPIVLGPVGIYGFRGLIGYRYVAEKEAAGLTSGVDSWYDYYKAPTRGINVRKFNGPDKTRGSGTPFSIGVGASLGTSFDNGTVLNIKAMLLLSIPSLFMIDGRAAILSARLGLDDSGEPPFFAFIAIGDNSLELGFGADFKMPSSSGDVLKLYADIQAGFFFNDSSKWYVNIGTKTNPVTARVLTLVTLTSYLMLSAKGIEAGARGEFDFKRKYGPIKVHAWAYIEVGGKISFEKPQFGAYLAAGVGADIDIKIVSLYASFDILFGVEAPKPFKIYGEFRLCVRIKIMWVFSFKFCGNLSISWEFNSSVDRDPINPILNNPTSQRVEKIVQGVNMLSNETFELAYLGSNIPSNLDPLILDVIIPIDTYIDIKTEKGFLPKTPVTNIIGGYNNPAERHIEMVPPDKIIRGKEVRQVKHLYSIETLVIKSWNPDSDTWEVYNPYLALYPSDPTLSTLKIGQFQKQGKQYNAVRLLATSPFSYTEQGQPGWYVPEQNGITAATLFCEADLEVEECANFLEKPLGTKYFCFNENQLFYSNEAAFLLLNRDGLDHAQVVSIPNPYNFNQSLKFENKNGLQIRLPEPSVEVNLRLTSFAGAVEIHYYASLMDDNAMQVPYGNPDPNATNPNDPHVVIVPSFILHNPVQYNEPTWLPITRIEIFPISANQNQIDDLIEQIALIEENNNQIALGNINGEPQSTEALQAELHELQSIGCLLADVPSFGNSFANGYLSAHLAFKYAEEFYERNAGFIYAVGYAENGPIILKTDLDGLIVWEKSIAFEKQFEGMRFHKIVQLDRDGKLYYVISGYNGVHSILLCVDEFGTKLWSKLVDFKDEDIHSFLVASFDQKSCYFVYSDKNGFDGKPTPTVLHIDLNGNVINQISLRLNILSDFGVVINAVKTYEKGLVLAGRGFRKESESVIYDLSENLQIHLVRHINGPSVTIQDVMVINTDDYIISAYSNMDDAVIVCSINGIGSPSYKVLPNSTNATSTLVALKDDGYIAIVRYPNHAFAHKITNNAVAWSKSFEIGSNNIGLESATYNVQADHLVFCNENENMLTRTNALLELCITKDVEFGDTGGAKLSVIGGDPERLKIKIDLVTIDSVIENLESIIANLCGDGGSESDQCYTALHQVCWLTLEQYQYNINIPSQAAIEEDTLAAVAGMTQYIQPVWRPNTSYVVNFELKDVVDDGASSPGNYSFTYGFTTGGPIGYFHKNEKATYGDILLPNGNTLEDANGIVRNPAGVIVPPNPLDPPITPHPDSYPLTNLTRYIDYNRSYPNADGSLLSAKPLFYNDQTTRISLYFSKAYATHFFHNWIDYNGNDALNGRLKIVIKDPREDSLIENPPYLDYDPADTQYTNIPQTIESWEDDEFPVVPYIFQMYQNLIQSNECIPVGGNAIIPPSQHMTVIPKHLKPLKLYTALVNNLFDRDSNGVLQTEEVHRFGFQTSRYATFKEQVESYIMARENRLSVDKKAESLIAAYVSANIQAGIDTLTGTPNPIGDALIPTFPNAFDRVVEGIFGLAPFATPLEKPEFKLIKDSNNGDEVIAVVILNPTPLNNTRVPAAEVFNLIKVLDTTGVIDSNYKVALSADYTKAIVMHTSLTFSGNLLYFQFQHPITGEALFSLKKGIDSLELDAAYDTIVGTPNAMSDNIAVNYQHPFDRIIEGLLALPPMEKAVSTEINVIRNSADFDKIVGLLIRNPEPFNNPKIPLGEPTVNPVPVLNPWGNPIGDIQDTIQVVDGSGNNIGAYKKFYSKDYSQVIIIHDSKEITDPTVSIKFKYKVWNGAYFEVPGISTGYASDEVGTIIISNIDIQSV